MAPEAVYAPWQSVVLSAGDSLHGERSLLLAGGRDQGVGIGDAVVREGRLLGIVASVGQGACRVRPYRSEEVLTWRIESEAVPGGVAFFTRQRRRELGPMVPEGLYVSSDPGAVLDRIRTGEAIAIHRFAHRDERRRLLGKWRR